MICNKLELAVLVEPESFILVVRGTTGVSLAGVSADTASFTLPWEVKFAQAHPEPLGRYPEGRSAEVTGVKH